ncbi:hypothetical protein E3A20_10710 [Planctomyces bekefii]|uniref:Uncharacterized protein n=1 Tax=Planctomyces bekefii TaxID=1653850 RepID=A0A5C6M725_9PLAN|nr:hypothetical protein E3A20_10710 [Planctomyces bekefii]
MSGERRRRRSSSSGDSAGSSGERAGVQRSERSEVPSGSRVDGERRRSGGGGGSRRRRRGRRMWLWLVPLVLGVLALLLIPWWNERGLRVAEW